MADTGCVIGIDYGTDSVRAVIVEAADGSETASAVVAYPRWKEGRYCDPAENRFRQHPRDHIEGLEQAVRGALDAAPAGTAARVRGIGVDTTGSTPGPVDRNGLPLALSPGFEHDPDAMFILWKDHTSVAEAEEINDTARSWGGTDFTMYEGGVYSSEWFWAKMLHTLRKNPAVRKAAFSWAEHCDWIPALLTGNTDPLAMPRSRCAAGHKAMWHASWGGLPSDDFLRAVDPLLAGMRDRLYTETVTADIPAGTLTPEWAKRLGLAAGITVGTGAFDAHMGAVGGAIRPYILSKVIGTSTCDMLVAPAAEVGNILVRGICGQVDGSVVPGMIGMEAGQSAYGDVFAWFRDLLLWPVERLACIGGGDSDRRAQVAAALIPELAAAADALPVTDSGIVALDWLNGRRTPDANQLLKGAVTGLNLGSTAPAVFKALVESTAFGSRMIVERFETEGIPIRGVIALGGVARKSPFAMQVLADVLNRPIEVAASDQTCALGAAMFAATAAGIYDCVEDAMAAMGCGFEHTYTPRPDRAATYDRLYGRYARLGAFIEQETRR